MAKEPTGRMIWVTFEKEGLHKYPAALNDPALATNDEYDVSFLGYIHRHIFKFKVWVSVEHNDRDIEFIQFKRWLEKLYAEKTLQLDFKSCEMIAEDLYAQIDARYPGRSVWIEVSEDGENGALMKWDVDGKHPQLMDDSLDLITIHDAAKLWVGPNLTPCIRVDLTIYPWHMSHLSEDQASETLGVVLRDKLKEYFDIKQEKSQKEEQ